jgi:ribonuclease Z
MRPSPRARLALEVVRRRLPSLVGAEPLAGLPDGLHVVVVGSGSPLPDRRRGQSCVVVVAGRRLLVVDAGERSSDTMNRMQLPVGQIDALLLTHFHSDHISGLGTVALQRWVAEGARTPLTVHGPPGVERVVNGFNEAFAQDCAYRTAHHGEQIAPPEGAGMVAAVFPLPAGADRAVVLEEDGLVVSTFVVDHSPVAPAVGFRFDFRGRSVVVSGDTVRAPGLVEASRGADLLLQDALSAELLGMVADANGTAGRANRAQILRDVPDYHATTAQAADLAREAGVGALALTHVIPPLPLKGLEEIYLADAPARFTGPMWIAQDGDLYRLPAGGGPVERSRIRLT